MGALCTGIAVAASQGSWSRLAADAIPALRAELKPSMPPEELEVALGAQMPHASTLSTPSSLISQRIGSAPASAGKPPCKEQVWPYLDQHCLENATSGS
jgi:hypothetical protein